MLNQYFNTHNFAKTQRLSEELMIEAIKIYGINTYYLPRNKVNLDNLFGEDPASSFETAVSVEMYVSNTDGFVGDGQLMSKFGVEVREGLKLQLSIRRFNEIKTEKLILENGNNLLLENSTITYPIQANCFLLEEGNSEGYSITSATPLPGDLIWVPLMTKMFEIKHVDDNSGSFFQLGQNYFYDLSVEEFEYSQEEFKTNVSSIDDLLNSFRNVSDDYKILMENGDILLQEDDSFFVIETYSPENNDTIANNSLYTNQSESIVDWSEISPFVAQNKKTRF